jgi:hypothetical protein
MNDRATNAGGAADAQRAPVDEEELLSWSTHPLRRRPAVATAVTVFIMLVGMLVFYATDSHLFGVLALVVLFASLSRFYLPTSYRLTDRRLVIKTTTQTISKNWSTYRSCYPDKNGILLSPFPQPSRLENFRGVFLMFAGNGAEVTRVVRERLGQSAPSSYAVGKENNV